MSTHRQQSRSRGAIARMLITNSGRLVVQDAQLPPKAETIDSFFQQQVQTLQQSLDGFDARLAWYVPNAVLPAAEIGDPAKDFKSSGRFGDGHCGTFRPGILADEVQVQEGIHVFVQDVQCMAEAVHGHCR